MEEHGITDETLGFLQSASLLPSEHRNSFLTEQVKDEGIIASIKNAIAFATDKGYIKD